MCGTWTAWKQRRTAKATAKAGGKSTVDNRAGGVDRMAVGRRRHGQLPASTIVQPRPSRARQRRRPSRARRQRRRPSRARRHTGWRRRRYGWRARTTGRALNGRRWRHHGRKSRARWPSGWRRHTIRAAAAAWSAAGEAAAAGKYELVAPGDLKAVSGTWSAAAWAERAAMIVWSEAVDRAMAAASTKLVAAAAVERKSALTQAAAAAEQTDREAAERSAAAAEREGGGRLVGGGRPLGFGGRVGGDCRESSVGRHMVGRHMVGSACGSRSVGRGSCMVTDPRRGRNPSR